MDEVSIAGDSCICEYSSRQPVMLFGPVTTVDTVGSVPDVAEPPDEIAKRVQWLVDHRAGGNQRQLARDSGLSENHIDKILARGGAKAQQKTLRSIAKGGGVHFLWLIEGKAPRDLDADAPPPPSVPPPRASPVDVDAGVLDIALFDAMDTKRFLPADFDAVRAAFRETGFLLKEHADLASVARSWLEAARQLRLEAVKPTAALIATRASVGKSPHAQRVADERDAAYNAEVDARLRAAGREPPKGSS
jgi:hypothetical protein